MHSNLCLSFITVFTIKYVDFIDYSLRFSITLHTQTDMYTEVSYLLYKLTLFTMYNVQQRYIAAYSYISVQHNNKL